MNSSQKPAGADHQRPETVFVREGGVPYAPAHEDPFVALFELMEVVEALCPEWPVRKPDTRAGIFLL